MNATVGVILALYNGAPFVQDQIESILRQTYPDWILYVHDDGSTDESVSIVDRYCMLYPEKIIRIADDQRHLGATLNFSHLALLCDTPYLMFCDQDDVWEPQKIELTYHAMQSLEEAYGHDIPLLVFSDLCVVDEKLSVLSPSLWKSQKLDPKISQDLYSILAQNVVTGCTVMINRPLKNIAFPIPTCHIVHDHWLAIQACYHGKTGYIAQPLVRYRQHGKNVLGALKIGAGYFFKKMFLAIRDVRIYREKYRHLGFPVNPLWIIQRKIVLNLKRLIR